LLAQLDKTLHRHAKLTLLSAQAGSGKTTLLIQWCALLEKGQIPFAWLTLEDADNDPIRFCNYLNAIVEKVPGFKESFLFSAGTLEYPFQGGSAIKPEALIGALHLL
jgi:LuxR family maltose regulon positive regulatory protein